VTAQSNAFSSLFLRYNSDSSSLLHHLFLDFISSKVSTSIKFCYFIFFSCFKPLIRRQRTFFIFTWSLTIFYCGNSISPVNA
jgi:hypothetical protein